jgi:hypothetical protein
MSCCSHSCCLNGHCATCIIQDGFLGSEVIQDAFSGLQVAVGLSVYTVWFGQLIWTKTQVIQDGFLGSQVIHDCMFSSYTGFGQVINLYRIAGSQVI